MSSLPVAAAGQPPLMRPASDRHFEASVNLPTAAIARRVPHTLSEAAHLGWLTDPRAALALLGCQIGAATLTAARPRSRPPPASWLPPSPEATSPPACART